ncbi:MAG: hypothetical protein IJ575_12040, partial [Selenomonadaceae bacterium]|nr:hypothetical protein [Selenomonadaceae bacterium]
SVIFYFNQNENQTITIESVGSDNLSIDGGIIYYVGSTIGSSESDYTFTSRTIIRMVGDEMISVESNFRDDDVKFAYYGSDGEIHTSPTRTDATWEFVEMHHVNRVVSNRNVVSNQNVTISNGDATDTIDFASYSFDEISTQFTDSGLIISIDDSSLNIVGTNMTQFSLASGKYTADFSNHTFSS